MTLERAHAFAALWIWTTNRRSSIKLPHPDRLIQGARDQVIAVRREGDRINAIPMTVLAFRPFDESSALGVPDANTFVQAAGRDITIIWRDGDSCNAVFDLEGEDALVLLDVPESDGSVT